MQLCNLQFAILLMSPLLRPSGILGLNARNLLYIKPFNPKKAVAFADDKLKTKMFLGSRGIPVAKMYARIENRRQAREFDFGGLPDECVLKPNEGYGGEGIVVLKGRRNGVFLENGRTPVTERELRNHMEDILDGKYSLSGHRDAAFFEQILVAHECFARFRPAGLPDIRVIVFNLVPVMAMVRIPTAESGGKANVHLGGIGIGIDIAKGVTTHATRYNRVIMELPHGGSPAGIALPYWHEILLISSRIQQITNIGYVAVDITIDRDMGPSLLEVNARAGLMVQVANLAPLRSRLERVAGLKVSSPEKGVRLGQELFGEKVTRAQEEQGPPVLGTRESIAIAGTGGTVEIAARIAPDRERTAFSAELVQELLERGMLEPTAEGSAYRVKFTLGKKKVQTAVEVDDVRGPERAVIGRRDLSGFLIDPLRTEAPKTRIRVRHDVRAVDRMLARSDAVLSILKSLRPINLTEERRRASGDPAYEPLFQYPALPEDIDEIEKRLSAPIRDESAFGELLKRKRAELLLRIDLLRARGDSAAFTDLSVRLFGATSPHLLRRAEHAVTTSGVSEETEKSLSAEQAREKMAQALDRYGLHEWRCVVRDNLVADCAVGGRTIALRSDAMFSAVHVEALIAHEIEVHALTAENGVHQPWLLLRRGTAGYLATQEGLAVWNQNRVLPQGHPKRLSPARSSLAVEYARTHGFKETRLYLEKTIGYAPEKALSKTIDVKRGLRDTSEHGAFTKGSVYLKGLTSIEAFHAGGGDLRRLFVGKVTLDDLDLIEKIPNLSSPLVLPEWLR